jgi:hypothetical protein
VTENKKPTLKPTRMFKFLPHRSFRRWRFGYHTLQHICLLPPSAAGLRPPQAKELQFPTTFEKKGFALAKPFLILHFLFSILLQTACPQIQFKLLLNK